MALFMYGTANNTGKGFFTVEDRRNFFLRGYGGHDGSNYVDIWVIGNNEKGDQTTDHYSMMGFTKAYNSAKKSCG